MIAHDGQHEIIVEKSRFICHVKRVYTDQEAVEFIKKIKRSLECYSQLFRLPDW